MAGVPFSRYNKLLGVIGALIATNPGVALSTLGMPEWNSRGHGRGTPARNFLRDAGRSHYAPHQGKKEIARRHAQILAGKLSFSERV